MKYNVYLINTHNTDSDKELCFYSKFRVNALLLTLFTRYIFYRNLQFLNLVIIIKTKVLLPHIGDLSQFCLFYWGPLIFVLPKTFKLFGFQIFWIWASLMKVIPETCLYTLNLISTFLLDSVKNSDCNRNFFMKSGSWQYTLYALSSI